MLPYLKKRQVAALIVKNRHPNGNIDELDNSEPVEDGLEACAKDMISAYDAKDSRQLAQALRNAFELLESEPHEEVSHNNEE